MNFAYLDLSDLAPPPPPLTPIPCSLDEAWQNFEKELSKFKLEFARTRSELVTKTVELDQKSDDMHVLKTFMERLSSSDLKASVDNIIDNYAVEAGIDALTTQCQELMGKTEAMKKVLTETNAERYASFVCALCMDRLVDVFLDPCGHMVCELCWVRTKNKTACPGCRSPHPTAKKIFTLS